ncbi:ATP-dependent RNA helicase DBP7 [Striga asiatica]|uniref:ATP-dependent RNA helicase DBP7 n=1 Tax=Striga asiatica TaxID=4170 RepID=A0A5A7P9Q8_STRAF|nr:ATP-dependent RNA helicase DBP7 [Striga asiatica]
MNRNQFEDRINKSTLPSLLDAWPLQLSVCFGWMKPVKCSLSLCPLKFTIFFTEILLLCKCNLKKGAIKEKVHKIKWKKKRGDLSICDINRTLCSITRSQALPLNAYLMKNLMKSKPDNAGPTPPYPFNRAKTPVCIDSNQCSNLPFNKKRKLKLLS